MWILYKNTCFVCFFQYVYKENLKIKKIFIKYFITLSEFALAKWYINCFKYFSNFSLFSWVLGIVGTFCNLYKLKKEKENTKSRHINLFLVLITRIMFFNKKLQNKKLKNCGESTHEYLKQLKLTFD